MSWTKTRSPWRLNAPLQTWTWVSVQMCIWCKMQAQTQTQEYFASRLYLFCILLHLGTKEKKRTAELVWLFSALFCDLTSCSILYFVFEKLRLLMHLKFLQFSCLKNSWENRKLIHDLKNKCDSCIVLMLYLLQLHMHCSALTQWHILLFVKN